MILMIFDDFWWILMTSSSSCELTTWSCIVLRPVPWSLMYLASNWIIKYIYKSKIKKSIFYRYIVFKFELWPLEIWISTNFFINLKIWYLIYNISEYDILTHETYFLRFKWNICTYGPRVNWNHSSFKSLCKHKII